MIADLEQMLHALPASAAPPAGAGAGAGPGGGGNGAPAGDGQAAQDAEDEEIVDAEFTRE
jgi:hypothetical protein